MTEQAPPLAWFFPLLAFVGGVYSASLSLRLLSYLALSLRRPRDLRRRYGAWAVVTGPTSGIGRSVALELARRGINLVLLDLDAANLEETSDMVVSRHGVETKTVVFDLSLVGTPQGNDTSLSVTRVPERLGQGRGIGNVSFSWLLLSGDESVRRLRAAIEGLDVGVLVNNAGLSRPSMVYLHEADVEALVRMVRVNLWALTEVTAAVLPGMLERGRGAIVNMGSASSEAIPSFPLNTIYAATKRYISHTTML
jgi:17beta-estradiol 17-dehydrogenase / very-long-chain 3-oxoacyl-CoA reductase